MLRRWQRGERFAAAGTALLPGQVVAEHAVARRHLPAPHHAGPRPIDGLRHALEPVGLCWHGYIDHDGLGRSALEQLRVEHERQPHGINVHWRVLHLKMQVRRCAIARVADVTDQLPRAQACALADRGWDRAGLEVRVGDVPAGADVLDDPIAGQVREGGPGLNREHGLLVR